jgi:hypothetical protein
MKNLFTFVILLFFASVAFATDPVLTAIASAYSSAKAHPQKVISGTIPAVNNWTIRTDVYTTDKQGSGFQVVATLRITATVTASLIHQSGPETMREKMPPLALFKTQLITALQAQYAATIAKGVVVNGVTLAATDASQAKLTSLFLLMPQISPSPSTITIIDINGAPQTMTYLQAYAALVSYGIQCATLQVTLANQLKAINAAATFDQLAP